MTELARPPRENLIRAVAPTRHELRTSARPSDGARVMFGFLARFNEWTEIQSLYEGNFLERVAPGAFRKTITENGPRIKVLFEHGLDPQIGKKVLGSIDVLEEREEGVFYEVSLLDTSYNADLLPGIEQGLYGASFRFNVVGEDFVLRPPRSERNPEGIPERTILELSCREFGPCTWPAYENASAGLRSLTDEFLLERFAEEDPERLEAVLGRSRRLGSGGVRAAGRTAQSGTASTTPLSTNLVVPQVAWGNGFADANYGAGGRSANGVLGFHPVGPVGDVRVADEGRYARTAEYIGGTPWAMHPQALAIVLGIIGERMAGHRPSDEEIRERIGTRTQADSTASSDSVAVIPIVGPIIPRASLMSDVSGATSVTDVQASLREAVADPAVKSILLDIDSPGGSVDLVPELATEIMNARGTKPIVAQANTFAASAAYWIGSAADELVVSPSGQVGSIGVYSAHEDQTALQEKVGVKTTLVSAGKYKTEGSPFEPLSEEGQSEMQRKVDAYYEMFVGAVAKGRGTTVKDVKANFGEGRMVMAPDAVSRGMADSVGTFDETLARLERSAAAEALADTPPDKSEPEPSEATTRGQRPEPEPPEATTRGSRELYGQRKEKPAWHL